MKIFLRRFELISNLADQNFRPILHSGQNYKRLKKKVAKNKGFYSTPYESARNGRNFTWKILAYFSDLNYSNQLLFYQKNWKQRKKWFFVLFWGNFHWIMKFFILPHMNRPIMAGISQKNSCRVFVIHIKRINPFYWKKTKTRVKNQFCAQLLHFYPFWWGNFFRFFFSKNPIFHDQTIFWSWKIGFWKKKRKKKRLFKYV